MYLLGFDVGGTKCAAITAEVTDGNISILKKSVTPTDLSVRPEKMIEKMIEMADAILTENPDAIGVSCGGPLDSTQGVILGPPNLPGWDYVPITELLNKKYGVPVKLQNDANACALAEWKFGAGRGSRNMMFMTFGTGLGAGLIINGALYEGTNGNAGELGHIRLRKTGPVGYGKSGSFEGFCSGGGIAKLGYMIAKKALAAGKPLPSYCNGLGIDYAPITAKDIAQSARAGDEAALRVFKISGEMLGHGLASVIDMLNPEKIVIGSIFARCHDLLWHHTRRVLSREALSISLSVCEVLPSELGEQIGDYAAIATAYT